MRDSQPPHSHPCCNRAISFTAVAARLPVVSFADCLFERFPAHPTCLRGLSLPWWGEPQPVPPYVATFTRLEALSACLERGPLEAADGLKGIWARTEAALRPLRALKVSPACVQSRRHCHSCSRCHADRRLALSLLQVLYLGLAEAYDDATRQQRREERALLRSLWDASGLPARLELGEEWDLDRWLASAGM